ncbi:MAG: glucose-1-phosphate adenylyltransferase subunit GlgD [Ruminococcaceae bacterium]|nr:glucose-1-phosphate adenylyltransferase subunit GlgD [Oscillospiraceae bacterium]
MTTAGLIFANIHDNTIPELTRTRSMASVPFGARYRLIDFMLSNMVNSGITKVGIIANNNYESLLDHLGTGKDWDLARRSGGIKILPPHITSFDNTTTGISSSRLEAIIGAANFINRCKEDYLVMADCDVICNIDLTKAIAAHDKSGADITFVTQTKDLAGVVSAEKITVIDADEEGRVTEFSEKKVFEGKTRVYTNIMIVKRTYLVSIMENSMAHGYTRFLHDILSRSIGTADYRIYEYDGFYGSINSMETYFSCSMQILEPKVRENLFGKKNYPVLTKVRNSAPTRYCDGAKVTNSVIADGCVIEGTVENSIIFRGVHVCPGAVVKNSILFQDTYVCSNATLNCVIADKNVMVREGRVLSGHETMPFFIGKCITV